MTRFRFVELIVLASFCLGARSLVAQDTSASNSRFLASPKHNGPLVLVSSPTLNDVAAATLTEQDQAVILVNAARFNAIPKAVQDFVMAHEEAHIRKGHVDVLKNNKGAMLATEFIPLEREADDFACRSLLAQDRLDDLQAVVSFFREMSRRGAGDPLHPAPVARANAILAAIQNSQRAQAQSDPSAEHLVHLENWKADWETSGDPGTVRLQLTYRNDANANIRGTMTVGVGHVLREGNDQAPRSVWRPFDTTQIEFRLAPGAQTTIDKTFYWFRLQNTMPTVRFPSDTTVTGFLTCQYMDAPDAQASRDFAGIFNRVLQAGDAGDFESLKGTRPDWNRLANDSPQYNVKVLLPGAVEGLLEPRGTDTHDQAKITYDFGRFDKKQDVETKFQEILAKLRPIVPHSWKIEIDGTATDGSSDFDAMEVSDGLSARLEVLSVHGSVSPKYVLDLVIRAPSQQIRSRRNYVDLRDPASQQKLRGLLAGAANGFADLKGSARPDRPSSFDSKIQLYQEPARNVTISGADTNTVVSASATLFFNDDPIVAETRYSELVDGILLAAGKNSAFTESETRAPAREVKTTEIHAGNAVVKIIRTSYPVGHSYSTRFEIRSTGK